MIQNAGPPYPHWASAPAWAATTTAAWRGGDSCDHGVLNVAGPGVAPDCSMARYGSTCAFGSPGCCAIHCRAARQAWKYSSSVDSAGASTDVVTPFGETPTAPDPEGWLSDADGFGDACDDDVGPPPEPDEQLVSAADMATAMIIAASRPGRPALSGYLRMPPIYARLSAVMQGTGFRECCQAR